jgi:hypothetical protein
MPETFQALAIAILAFLPGALYTWAFERLAGAWGARLSDRILRFVEVSAIAHALMAPLTYWLWVDFVRSGRLAAGRAPWTLWLVPLLYVAVPIVGGSLVGAGTKNRARWSRIFTGPEPAPRAWDHLFGARPDGWIRLKLKSGPWVGGAYSTAGDADQGYAAGYPEDPDLYLVETMEVDPATGRFVKGSDGNPVSRGSGLLVRWAEVEYLEFIDA